MTGQQPPPGGWQPPPGQPPQWPPGPPPQPPPSSGRLVASIIGGGILGVLAGGFAPFVPVFLAQVFFNTDVYGFGAGAWLGLAMFVTVPIGGLLGALWGMRRARRPRQPRQPIDPGHYPNRVIRRDRNER
jgi:hypothetical protein